MSNKQVKNTGDSDRISIFSFSKRGWFWSSICFVGLVCAYGLLLVCFFSEKLGEGFFNRLTAVIQYVSIFVPVAGTLAFTIDLGDTCVMILRDWWKEKQEQKRQHEIDQAAKQSRIEAQMEAQAKIDAWFHSFVSNQPELRRPDPPPNIVDDDV